MGQADVITESFMSDKQNFTDAFNIAFFIIWAMSTLEELMEMIQGS